MLGKIVLKTLSAAKRPPVFLALCALILAACGAAKVNDVAQLDATPHIPPDLIYVTTFAVTPTKTNAGERSASAEASPLTQQVQDQVAGEVVQRLQVMGLHAIHTDDAPAVDQNILIVRGQLTDIDPGSALRRVVIGLGSGKSQVDASVQIVYHTAQGRDDVLETYDTSADSGHMPGMAETGGVGAVAGHVVVSAVAGGTLHTVSETSHATPLDDAQRAGHSIAKQVAQVGVDEQWLSKDAVK